MPASPTSKRLSHGIHARLWGDHGSLIVLIPGWPETLEAFSAVAPVLAETHRVVALDPPGLGESAPSVGGYDTDTIGRMVLEALVDLDMGPAHVVGHDVGAWIAYGIAAQARSPQQVASLALLDGAVPGGAARDYPLPDALNVKLWQFSFNALPVLPEVLTAGRERELFDWLFDYKAVHPERITAERRDLYVQSYARPSRMTHGFAYYRSAARSAEQNQAHRQRPLTIPVLALGGAAGVGAGMIAMAKTLGTDVTGAVIEDCGHYLMEEQPDVTARQVLDFIARIERAGSPASA